MLLLQQLGAGFVTRGHAPMAVGEVQRDGAGARAAGGGGPAPRPCPEIGEGKLVRLDGDSDGEE